MKKKLITALSLLAALCLHAQPQGEPAGGFGGFQMPEIKMEYSRKYADVDYAGDGEVYHRLDIYLPKEKKESYPVVVHIYGSAWYSNNSKGMADLGTICQALLDAGYAVVTPNHRSSSDAKFPAQIEDIKAVIRFIRGNAARYGFDTSFIAASGFSSGGHLASLAATSGGVAGLEGTVGDFLQLSSSVDAACDWSGPINLTRMDCAGPRNMTVSPEEDVIGLKFSPDNEAAFDRLSPIYYIDGDDPPVIIFHGVKDNVVPCCQATEFYETLDKAGVKTELTLEEEGGHGFNMYNEKNLRAMVDFLDAARSAKSARRPAAPQHQPRRERLIRDPGRRRIPRGRGHLQCEISYEAGRRRGLEGDFSPARARIPLLFPGSRRGEVLRPAKRELLRLRDYGQRRGHPGGRD